MKQAECQAWLETNRTVILQLVPEALDITRIDNKLFVFVETVKQAKADWHKQRDMKRTWMQKRALRVAFPDLAQIIFQGPLEAARPDGMLRTPHGYVHTQG
jgi:hypothetical protein